MNSFVLAEGSSVLEPQGAPSVEKFEAIAILLFGALKAMKKEGQRLTAEFRYKGMVFADTVSLLGFYQEASDVERRNIASAAQATIDGAYAQL